MGRHDDGRRPKRGRFDRDVTAWMPAFALLPLILLGLASAAHMMKRESARPVVGDMVVFTTDTPGRDLFRVTVPAARVDPAPGTPSHCHLDSTVMATFGGSLVVEQRLPIEPPWFRLSWSGTRTDQDGRDCGTSARVEVTRVDLRKLATAAGGFGLGRR